MTRVKELMASLGCTEEEALEIIADDDAIDHGADLFELTEEQKKVSKAARSVDRKPGEQKAKKPRKEDADKRALMAMLEETFGDMDAYTVSNPERQIDFEYNGRKFRIVLSAPRK